MGIDLYILEQECLSRQAATLREAEQRRQAALPPRPSPREGAAGLLIAAAARLAPSLHVTVQHGHRPALDGLR